MKIILAILLSLIALTLATPAQKESLLGSDVAQNGKRNYDTPANSHENVAKEYLLGRNKGIIFNIASSIRFTYNFGWLLALNDIVAGEVFTNGNDIVDDDLISEEQLADLTLAAGLLAHNPVTSYIARRSLLSATTTFTLVFNVSELTTSCNSIPALERFVSLDNTYCRNDDTDDVALYVRVDDIIAETDKGVAHRNFVYRLIDALVGFYGVNATNPLTGAIDGSAANAYKSCYNKLYLDGVAPRASISLPSYSPLGGGDETSNCGATFEFKGHRICYSNGAPYSFQQDVPLSSRITDNSTESSASGQCGSFRTQDGFCGVPTGATCGYISCLLDGLYCDYDACYKARPQSGSKTCCSVVDNGVSVFYCPPDNDLDKLICAGTPDAAQCCTDSSATNCVAAQKEEVGSCFIATAAFGSSMDPNVWTLRVFRDNYLLTNPLGRAFVQFYYSVSPQIASFIAQSEGLRAVTRALLTPIVSVVSLF